MNLLLNPEFRFHSFTNSRTGKAESFRSGSVACWNEEKYGDAEAYRSSRIAAFRPRFPIEGVVVLHPGKNIHQFSLLAETGLDHGDRASLSVFGHQFSPDSLCASLHLMQLDSAAGEWSPGDCGQEDKRTFPKHSRGELVRGRTWSATSGSETDFELRIENAEITGAFTEDPAKSTNQQNTIGLLIEFTNTSADKDVWIYSPCLARGAAAANLLPEARSMPNYYRGIPRTIQKLWRGDPLHIIVMGSSIDRGSANPPQYLYDEDLKSPTYKQPIAGGEFDGVKVGHTEWNDYIGWWQHYFMYGGRLRRALMQKFDYPINKLLLNTMACDGSSISEAHSAFAEYASLSLPPDANLNGHRTGKTWQELYPEVFSRPGGPRPDLVIFGSGANEKVDGADEIALFEGAIRWFQRHYPGTEFLFCMFQNRESYTPNAGHLAELALRYQIPVIDFGRILSLTTRYCNSYALVPRDGHPQAAAHYLWAQQLESAFDVADPVESGLAQLHLPERVNDYTLGWEGDIQTYTGPSPRIRNGVAFILDDTTVNLWATCKGELVGIRIDGKEHRGSRRKLMPGRDLRNSVFATGKLALGDRHIVEVTGTEAMLMAVDSKVVPGRQWVGVDSTRWSLGNLKPQAFRSEWGAPYGSTQVTIPAGQSVAIEVVGTDFSVAYLDQPNGGSLEVDIDGQKRLAQPTNVPFEDAAGNNLFMENRKALPRVPFGLHRLRVRATDGRVALLGVFTYDTRSNRSNERRVTGFANPGDTLTLSPAFAARPVVLCTDALQALPTDVTTTTIQFSGTGLGGYEVVGE